MTKGPGGPGTDMPGSGSVRLNDNDSGRLLLGTCVRGYKCKRLIS